MKSTAGQLVGRRVDNRFVEFMPVSSPRRSRSYPLAEEVSEKASSLPTHPLMETWVASDVGTNVAIYMGM